MLSNKDGNNYVKGEKNMNFQDIGQDEDGKYMEEYKDYDDDEEEDDDEDEGDIDLKGI